MKLPGRKRLIVAGLIVAGLSAAVAIRAQLLGSIVSHGDSNLTPSTSQSINVGFEELAPLINQEINTATPFPQMTSLPAGLVVPHHLPTAIPLLSRAYVSLRNQTTAAGITPTFVVIGPDHRDRGRSSISTTTSEFRTVFGTVTSDLQTITAITSAGLAREGRHAFENEHSIGAELLFIRRLFPNSSIIPFIINSKSTKAEIDIFSQKLPAFLPQNALIIVSSDFSHYLSETQARPIDYQSAQILKQMEPGPISRMEVDSPQSTLAITNLMRAANRAFEILAVENSATWSGDTKRTTGYVLGFYH